MKTSLPLLDIDAAVHRDSLNRLLMLDFRVEESAEHEEAPARIAIVLDRSGSMEGDPLTIARAAAARFVRSLSSRDRIVVVAYDDRVEVVAPLGAPSEAGASATERIDARGSTALYEGWLTGAKLVGPGGRVILLSDGHANVGAFTDARDLARHADRSYEKYRVVTSTIGIGDGYDEALMGGMARAGKGGHYYAATLGALGEALAQERYAVSQAALSFMTLRVGETIHSVGSLWRGEERRLVVPLADLETPVTVRMTDAATGERTTYAIAVPTSWATVPEATLRLLFDRAAAIEAEVASEVHSAPAAARAATRLREVLFALLGHELADTPEAVAERARIEASVGRLNELALRFDEGAATIHRKRAMQTSHARAAGEQAYAALEGDEIPKFLRAAPARSYAAEADVLTRLPSETWLRLGRAPVTQNGRVIRMACLAPRDGFAASELARLLPDLKFVAEKAPITSDELERLLGAPSVTPQSP